MYQVIGETYSRAARVMWMLEELGQPYEQIKVAPHSEEAYDHNPSGKIPALIDGGEVLTDSTAILTYLADKHGGMTYPAGTIERARQDGLTNMILDELDAVLWTGARHSFVLPKDKRLPEVKESLKWEYARNCDRLATYLKGPFLMGDKMTIPDIIAVHCLNWAFSAKFPMENEKLLAYAKQLRGRETFRRAMGKA
jgi:glutathione S-transferase